MRRFALLAALVLSACGGDKTDAPRTKRDGPPVVQCVNYPLAYFARRVAGDRADVRFEVPAGHDPAFWKPDDAQVAKFQEADLILCNGAGYARWMKTVSLPTSRVVDTSEAFADELITISGGVTHSHGPAGEHDHGDTAFTTWLDFGQARLQAVAVRLGLGRLLPDPLPALDAELKGLHQAMTRIGKAAGDRPLLASHPVYQYLARAYGLSIKSEHFEPGTVPSDEELEILASMLRNYPAKLMLWEAEPLPETVRKLEALGVKSVVFDPCANTPAEGDFLTVMQANVERLEKALAD